MMFSLTINWRYYVFFVYMFLPILLFYLINIALFRRWLSEQHYLPDSDFLYLQCSNQDSSDVLYSFIQHMLKICLVTVNKKYFEYNKE